MAVRWRRLMTAKTEVANGTMYDHFIVNYSLDAAYEELESIVIKGKTSKIGHAEGEALCNRLLDEFANAPWIQKLALEFPNPT